jgi:hypothetical protein
MARARRKVPEESDIPSPEPTPLARRLDAFRFNPKSEIPFCNIMDSDEDTQMMDTDHITPFTFAEKGKGKAIENGDSPAYEDDNLPWYMHFLFWAFQH